MTRLLRPALLAAAALSGLVAAAHAADMRQRAVLDGLAPVSALPNTPAGRAALAANLVVTGAIQNGTLAQPTLLPFAAQQGQALKDAFITDGNATELADGLGTRLAAAYQAKARYADYKHFTSATPAVADLLGYANETTRADAGAGKYFFANGTTDGSAPVAPEAAALLLARKGMTDVFGTAYGRPGGTAASDRYGNARPFQTEPSVARFEAADYFGRPASNLDWLRGPGQNLTDSPSYPSGHTTYGYTESLMLAVLVPERYQQMIVRAAEYGNDRILMGAHYAMDVLGGRTLSLYDMAHLLANDPAYVGRTLRNTAVVPDAGQTQNPILIADMQEAVRKARAELAAVLREGCGDTVAACARDDAGRFGDGAANEAFIKATQTYGLPPVDPEAAGRKIDVGTLAPEAGYLLTTAFPALTLQEADDILTQTLGPGGGFLDDGSAFGVYSRLDLYAAAGKAAARAAGR